MNMVERVARALRPEAFQAPETGIAAIDEFYVALRERARERARAAIAAMREPDNRMLRAAGKAMSPDKRPTPERVSVARKHTIRYMAMIDAALVEPVTHGEPA